MFQCRVVHRFWMDIYEFFLDQLVDIPIDVKTILFGIHKKPVNSVENFIILAVKQYIWNNKFRDPRTPLSMAAFKNILKSKIEEYKEIAILLNDDEIFEKWNIVYWIL